MPEIELPWGAWYRETSHVVELPRHWSVDVLAPGDAPRLTSGDIGRAISRPVGSPPLDDLARGAGRACIVVDDLARPTRAGALLPHLTRPLHEAGLSADDIRILVATGSHGAVDRRQLEWKLGAGTLAQYPVECHDCRSSDLTGTGLSYGERELRINRTYYDADLKLAVGSVLPHSFAGFSGGAKLVLPGLSDLPATARSHKFVQLGLRGGADPNENRFRLEMEKLVRDIGLDFVVCVLANKRRETAGLCAGDMVAAHRRACRYATESFRTPVEPPYDVLVLNAYPKDVDLIQSENVFTALKTAKAQVVAEDGVIVITTAAPQGIGHHGLFDLAGLSYRQPRKKRSLGERELWLYTPGLPAESVHQVYWDGYPVFHDRAALCAALQRRLPSRSTRAAVLPCAPMQRLETSAR